MNEKYKPSEEEIKKAEDSMSDEQIIESAKRDKTKKLHDKIDKLIYKNIDTYDIKIESIKKLRKELEAKGLNPTDYKLWHRMIGSTPQKTGLPFDTLDNDIEKFIENL